MQLKPLAALLLTSVMGVAVAAPAKPADAAKATAPLAAPATVAPAALNLDPAALGKTGAGAPPTAAAQATPSAALAPMPSAPAVQATAQPMPVLEEGAVNPFTGESLSAERRKREADRLRAENQVLEERIKQVGLLNDLNHAPVKKRVEMEIYLENTRPKVSATPPVKAPIGTATVESSMPAKDKNPKKGTNIKVANGKGSPAVASAQKPAVSVTGDTLVKPKIVQTPPPEVVGVIRTKDGSTAILSNNGKTILARPGEASSVGIVTAVSEKQVQLGSQTLDYNQTSVARIQRTDKEPKQENSGAQALPVSTRSTITLPPIPGTGSSPSLPPSVRPGNPSVAPTAPAAP